MKMNDFKDELIQQYDEMESDYDLDEMIENERENTKIQEMENIVLLKNLLSELLSQKQLEILSILVDNAIESNTDYLTYNLGKEEKEYWTTYISDLKEIKGLIK